MEIRNTINKDVIYGTQVGKFFLEKGTAIMVYA